MRRHPDIDLLEGCLEAFLELLEELPILDRIGDINEDSRQLISIRDAFVPPAALNDL
jgi:hypothetical protein